MFKILIILFVVTLLFIGGCFGYSLGVFVSYKKFKNAQNNLEKILMSNINNKN